MADFKNGLYSINGVSKTFSEMWGDYSDENPSEYQPVNIVAGVGIYGNSSEGNLRMSPYTADGVSELWAAQPDTGFTFVIDYSIASTGSRRSEVALATHDFPNYADYWVFANYYDVPGVKTRVLSDATGDSFVPMDAGVHRAAVTFSQSFIAMSVNGLEAEVRSPTSPNDDANELVLDIQAGRVGSTGVATTIIEKVVFYPVISAEALRQMSR